MNNPRMSQRRFWISHGMAPAAVLAAAVVISEYSGFDLFIADHFFFDGQRWIGADTWWAKTLIHTGGRDFIRMVAAGALVGLIASFLTARARQWRQGAAFVFVSIVLSVAVVGGLKSVTNVDCPWSLHGHGGENPHVGIFGDRPDELPRARCFPGAHSSSAFALMCFYFLWRTRKPRAAKVALAGAVLLGAVFSFGQQARGAHFISHDLASALTVWCVLLAVSTAFGLNREASSSINR